MILMIANCQAGNIILLLIEYSLSCDSFDCELWKNSQFAIKTRPTVIVIKLINIIAYALVSCTPQMLD